MYLHILPKLWQTLIFCIFSYQQKTQKISDFGHFKDHNYGSRHDNYTNDPIFLIFFLKLYPLVCFISRFPRFSSMGSPLCIKFWSVKYTFTCQRRYFKSVNIDIPFLCKTCKLLVYDMPFSQFDFFYWLPYSLNQNINWFYTKFYIPT